MNIDIIGLKQNTIKTIMGPVEYRRAIYENIDDNGNKRYVYLLDEYLNMETIGKISGMLVEKVLENVSIASYRKSANNVSSLTGQNISHGAVWGVVQKSVNLPEPPEGLCYRNLGTMEHNVFDVLGYRMKKQKMSWSIKEGRKAIRKMLSDKPITELIYR